ncbi:MFS transporter [uncultured Maritalea sp.]|uniref:MFS transporter n=1 Tax=uncultured Maritalea sp. TaxID=757249 RepID=UPI0026366F76|nr:MFS transporter [uncultured Maritalea sp.]
MISKRSIFQNVAFRKLFSAQLIALLGTGLTTIALALLAFQIAGDRAGVVLGTALAIKMLSFIFVAPVVGGLIRPSGRKRLLVVLDVARAACVLVLPFVTAEWQIYLLIFVLNACSAGFTPTFQSIIPQLFEDEEDYTKALSMARLAYDLENLLSPTIAAALLLFVSFDVFFVANSAAFLVSAGLVLSTRMPAIEDLQDKSLSAKDKILKGFQIYRKTPRLMGMLAMFLVVSAAGAMVIVNTVVLVRGQFGGGESMVAIAMSAFGLGSLVAALMVPRLVNRLGDQAVMRRGGWLLGLTMLLAGYVGRFDLLLVAWFMLGIGYSLVQTPAGRVLRRSASDEDLPKLFAAQFTLSHLCWLASYPAAGWLASSFGFQPAFLIFALVSLGAMILSQQLWQNDDPSAIEHQHDELYHDHLHYHGSHHQHVHEGWEGPEPHRHPHKHEAVRHSHKYVIDGHHTEWPTKTN